MKGISAIIATIILLLITVSMASVAYFYINGMVNAQIDNAFHATMGECSSDSKTMSFLLINDGQESITTTDLTFRVSNSTVGPTEITFSCDATDNTVASKGSTFCSNTSSGARSGKQEISVVSGQASTMVQIYC